MSSVAASQARVSRGSITARRDNAPEGWSVTCRFDHELDWETLGELFLCGILEGAPR